MPIRMLVVAACLAVGVICPSAQADPSEDAMETLRTDSFAIGIDAKGVVGSIVDSGHQKEVLPKGRVCPLLSVTVDGKTLAPTGASWSGKTLELSYGQAGVTAKVAVAAKPTHITFELLSVTPKEKVEMVVWGPFATTSDKNAGIFAGLLWDESFVLGLQCLNPKTVVTVKDKGERSLQGHCRDYERPQPASAYGYNFMASYPGTGVAGSKIALFGCPPDKALAAIEAIELAENLPHVTYRGQWVKTMPGPAYLGFEFGEDTIDQLIKVAVDSGFQWILHPSPWETWGHCEPKKSQFPHGRAGLKACIDKAHKAGLRVHVGTLVFITADDAYVTPKPDPRLATSGASQLTKEVAPKDTVLDVADGAVFSAPGQKKILRLGDELVVYGKVSGDKPARIEGCSRGAFGTAAQAHAAGTAAARLIVTDFFGTIFLGNRELNREFAQNAAKACREYGADGFGLDGLEGTLSCGLEYSCADYCQTIYDALGDLKGKVTLSGSGIDVYMNHLMDAMCWGEPWGAEFRHGMLDYRFMRMEQYRCSMLPNMLGQYAAQMYAIAGQGRPELNRCRVEDIEWLMALWAGNDAGFSLTFTPDWEAYLRGHKTSPIEALMLPNLDELTAAMRTWETAHQAKAFPPEVKKLIGERHGNFHLAANGKDSWTLYPLRVASGALEAGKSSLKMDNPYENAPVNFVIFNQGSTLSKIVLKLPNNVRVPLTDAELKGEEIIRYTGGQEATIYGRNWNKLRTVKVDSNLLNVKKGATEIAVEWAGDDKVKIKAEIRLVGPAWDLTPGKK
ncbi:MAG: hypothetical protein NTV86_23245 [Planctomycetota bacterium]|nr:hypothetical protein [Planctomycetota bacterium]